MPDTRRYGVPQSFSGLFAQLSSRGGAALACTSTVVALLVVGPLILDVVLTVAAAPGELGLALQQLLAPAHLQTLGRILVRAAWVASLGTLLGIPVGLYIGTVRDSRWASLLSILLVAPFFVNDSIKDYAWADCLTGLHQFVPFVSPYRTAASLLPLTLAAIPVTATLIAFGYTRTVTPQLRFFRQVSHRRGHIFLGVTLPLLLPFVLLGWLLAFGFTLPSSVEEQYLGAGTANNFQTLINSLLRTNLLSALLLGLLTLILAALAAWVAARLYAWRLSFSMRAFLAILAGCGRLRSADQPLARVTTVLKVNRGFGGPSTLVAVAVIAISWLPLIWVCWRGMGSCTVQGCSVSLAGVAGVLTSSRVLLAGTDSAELGVGAAAAGVMFGLIGLRAAVWGSLNRATLLVALLCLLAPAQTIAIALGQCLRLVGIYEGSLTAVWVSELPLLFPYCLGLGVATGLTLPRRSILALREFGDQADQVMNGLILRYGAIGVTSAGTFGLVLSLNEQTRTFYLGGAVEVLGTLVSAYLYAGQIHPSADTFGLSGVVLMAGVAGLFLSGWLGLRASGWRIAKGVAHGHHDTTHVRT